jgi:competence protein ComEC
MLSGMPTPIYRLLIPFSIGILINNYFSVTIDQSLFPLLGLIFLIGTFNSMPIRWKWQLAALSGSMMILLPLLCGAFYTSLRDHRRQPDWIGKTSQTPSLFLLTYRQEPVRTRTGWKCAADLIARQHNGSINRVSGGVFLYSRDHNCLKEAQPGISAWVNIHFKPIRNKPGTDFDYETYCLRNKITHQGFIVDTSTITTLPQEHWNISNHLHTIRMQLKKIVYNNLPDTIYSGLATALFIGWKGGLDPDIKQQYTRTGTIHIIAISGLHISLVFEILWRLLYPLLFIWGGQTIRTLLTVCCIWIFCFLAGGEASVLRAGIMFTFIHAGRWMERPVSGLQALGLSMLFLLVADPDWLFDPGFQLSHGAVLGILLLQPKLSTWVDPINPLLKSTWSACCMTVAATIGTLPFTLYYFHQIPLLFLPANLIAVPISSIILIGLFILIPMSAVSPAAEPISRCLEFLLGLMNGWIERLDRIPGMVWQW